jgi:hypothetical protein
MPMRRVSDLQVRNEGMEGHVNADASVALQRCTHLTEYAMKHRPLFRKRRPTHHRATRKLLLLCAVIALLGAGIASVLAR